MLVFGIIIVIVSLFLLYLKYRVVLTGERCKGKIAGIMDQNTGYIISGIPAKKHSYIVKIKNKKYYTAHGCIFLSLGKRKIGKEILVFKNDKYGKEVFPCFDFRIEVLAILLFLLGVFLMNEGLV